MLFADDCILFGKVTSKGVKVLKDMLKDYELNSGQCINFEKSTVFLALVCLKRFDYKLQEAWELDCPPIQKDIWVFPM